MKTLIATLFSALLFTLPVQAAPSNAPDTVIKNAVNNLQAKLKKNGAKYKANPGQYQKMVQDAVVPYFDTRYIAQLVLGRYWREADESQRSRFENAFRGMLIRTYADAMLEYYDSVSIDWKPMRFDPADANATVNSSLLRDGKPPIAVGFSMRKSNDKWQIFDIVVENISLVDNFRAQVSSEIKRSSLEEVIQRMENGSYGNKLDAKAKS